MERVLSIYLPAWDVELLRRRSAARTSGRHSRPLPLILKMADGRQEYVARCCGVCAAAGARPGMNLADARALCGEGRGGARVAEFDGARSVHAMHLLAKWAVRFSPAVCVDEVPRGDFPDDASDGLLLDVTGEGHLFGGEHLLMTEIATRLGRMGFSARLAIGPTIGAAWALARFGKYPLMVVGRDKNMLSGLSNHHSENDRLRAPLSMAHALEGLPLRALRLPLEMCETLKAIGLEWVGHLLALPRESLRERFGEEVLRRVDQALGRVAELLVPEETEEVPAVKRIFDGATVSLEGIFLTVQELLEELSARLLEKESGVRGLRLELLRFNAAPVARELVVGVATRDAKHLWKLLRPKVEQINLGYGVEAMTLTAFWTEKIEHRQTGAWEGAGETMHDRKFEAFLDTVVNRWGTGRVLAAKPVASHVPEMARAFRPTTETRRHEEHEGPRRREPPRLRDAERAQSFSEKLKFFERPTVLLEHPEAIEVVALQPDLPPSRVMWRGRVMDVVQGSGGGGGGPERIATPWWEVGRGGQAVRSSTRDYYKVLAEGTGEWLWVYRELESGKWYVQGMW